MLVKIDENTASVFNFACIKVGNKVALIDPEDYDRISPYTWYIKKSRFCEYAVRKKRASGKEFLIYMHRQITHCPNNMVVHHKNHNTLDNRKVNLPLMTPKEHNLIHRFF